MLLSSAYWDGGGDGTNWNDPLNWSGDALPGAADDVTINVAANPTIRLTSGDQSIASLVSDELLVLQGGTLAVDTTVQLSADLTLAGGTIIGGTVGGTGGTKLICTPSGGTLDGVTLNTNLDLTGDYSYANVVNGLTLNGTATLGYQARIYFNGGSQTLGGMGTVVFNNCPNQALVANANGMTLTIGPNITIRGGNGWVNNNTWTGSLIGYSNWVGGGLNASVVNQGMIIPDVSGTSIVINPSGTFTNQGTMGASNGGTLYINGMTGNVGATLLSGSGSHLWLYGTYVIAPEIAAPAGTTLSLNGNWSNAGGITTTSATLNLGGRFTVAGLGTLNRSGGTVNLTGTLDNWSPAAPGNLAVNAAAAEFVIFGWQDHSDNEDGF
ncbi:MAG: hypothetical protein NTU53_14365, partial [Planctomycetota bacterium]|nr:hypothetical protein [Planctomycetota bacterium]